MPGLITLVRKERLAEAYLHLLDQHLDEIVCGKVHEMLEVNQLAGHLCVSHKYLIEAVKEIHGRSPSHFYLQKILDRAKEQLWNSEASVSEIARRLTYDPSNFVKFFKKYEGMTPGQFRESRSSGSREEDR